MPVLRFELLHPILAPYYMLSLFGQEIGFSKSNVWWQKLGEGRVNAGVPPTNAQLVADKGRHHNINSGLVTHSPRGVSIGVCGPPEMPA